MITASSAFTTANAAAVKQPIYVVTIGTYARVFTNLYTGIAGQYPWIEEDGLVDQGKTINDMSGLADQHVINLTVLDVAGAITADFLTTKFEGLSVKISTGFPGMSQSDFLTIFTGIITGVDSTNQNSSYLFTLSDNSAVLSQTIYGTGDNGLPTSATSPKTLNAHPLDILIDVLENQVKGQFGIFFSPLSVDVARIRAYRDGPLAGIQFKFSLTSPVIAQDFIASQIMVPLGGYLWVNYAGMFTVNFFYPINAPVAVASIDGNSIVGIPTAAQAPLVNSMEFRFDSDGNNYFSDALIQLIPSILQYGFVGSTAVQSDGMRSALQGFVTAAFTAHMVFSRYGFYNLNFGNGSTHGSTSSGTPITCLWSKIILEPGDLINVSCSQIPDRVAGVIGITNKLFEVLEVHYDFQQALVSLTLIDASYLKAIGISHVSSNSQASYTSSSLSDRSNFMFLCGVNGKYSNGDNGNRMA